MCCTAMMLHNAYRSLFTSSRELLSVETFNTKMHMQSIPASSIVAMMGGAQLEKKKKDNGSHRWICPSIK